jgi:hypothetical protein
MKPKKYINKDGEEVYIMSGWRLFLFKRQLKKFLIQNKELLKKLGD